MSYRQPQQFTPSGLYECAYCGRFAPHGTQCMGCGATVRKSGQKATLIEDAKEFYSYMTDYREM